MFPTRAQIIVPLDLSAQAEAVLPSAAALAKAFGCELTLLHVVAPASALMAIGDGAMIEPRLARECQQAWIDAAQARLDDCVERLSAAGLTVRTQIVAECCVADAIIAAAHRDATLLIAMTAHRFRAWQHLIMNGTTQAVVRAAGVPVLIQQRGGLLQPAGSAARFDTILVALDGSAVAEQALLPAQALAQATAATLLLVAVVPPAGHARADGGGEPLWMAAERVAASESLAQYVEQHAKLLRAAGARVRVRIGCGEPAEQLVSIAGRERADLVLMATHGHGGFRRLMLGSVAHDVARRLTTPLLLVPGRAGTRQAAICSAPVRAAARPALTIRER